MFQSPSNVHSLTSTTGDLTETLSTQNTPRIFWDRKGFEYLSKFFQIIINNFQTTVGRLLCEKAADLKMVNNIYYIVLARDSDGDQLKKQFREEFQTENKDIQVHILDRQQAIKTFGIKPTFNEPKMIKLILKSVPSHSLVFCDEVHMKVDSTQRKKDYDWTGISNFREQDNVWLILSFKPVAERIAEKETLVNVTFPVEAKVVTLTKSYRQSVTLFKALQSFHSRGV